VTKSDHKERAYRPSGDVHPFTLGAIAALFNRSNRKPRDVLRKAQGLVEHASNDNLDTIDEKAVARYLDAVGPDTEADIGPVVAGPVTTSPDWSEG
jgi:hypothetical protein